MRKPKPVAAVERGWEHFLWGTRLLVMIAVISGLFAALMLFVLGARDIWMAFREFLRLMTGQSSNDHAASIAVLSAVIGSIDTFLIAVVVLLFCFGLYELFISRIDPAKGSETEGILKITNLEALKDKIASVIIMALVVKFFQIILTLEVQSILDSLLYAAGVGLLSLSVLLLQVGQRILAKFKGGHAHTPAPLPAVPREPAEGRPDLSGLSGAEPRTEPPQHGCPRA